MVRVPAVEGAHVGARSRVPSDPLTTSTDRAGPGAAHLGGHDDNPFGNPFSNPFEPPRRSVPEMRWEAMEAAARRKDDVELEKLAERMVRDDPVAGPRFAEQLLASYVDQLWRHGWQPAEVVRQARRRATKVASQVLELAIHADHARRIPTRDGWLLLWVSQQGHDDAWAMVQVAKALAAIGYLPVVDTLIPPPGRPGSQPPTVRGLPRDTGAEDPVLRRVRKLLAKAESTSYSSPRSSSRPSTR